MKIIFVQFIDGITHLATKKIFTIQQGHEWYENEMLLKNQVEAHVKRTYEAKAIITTISQSIESLT